MVFQCYIRTVKLTHVKSKKLKITAGYQTELLL